MSARVIIDNGPSEEAPAPPPTLLERFFPFTKRFKPQSERQREMSPLPIPLESYNAMAGSVDKTAIMPFSWKFMRDMVYTSDLLSLVVRTKTNETFRNGLEIEERFQCKCPDCGREYEEEKLVCPFDGSETILPNYDEWKGLNEFVKGSNRFDETILKVMREVDTDLHIGDNGYMYLEREYSFDGNGRMSGDPVREVIRMDPNMMRLIISRYGMGTSEMGSYPYFCTTHRQEIEEESKPGDYFCAKCGKQMLPAWYMSLTKAERIYYGPSEIYHIKLYSNAQGYGVTPLLSVYMKVNTLLRMDKFVLEAYSLQRSPQALLLLRGKRDSIHRGWEWLMQKSRENPNMIWPLVIEGTEDKGQRMVEYQQFDLKPIEWSWGEMRQEFRNVVGAVYGVQPIFSSGAQQSTGGLANEGLQLAVTSLAIKQSQHEWNVFLEFLSLQLGSEDYKYMLNPNEQEDELRDLEVEQKRITIAQQMIEMGYAIETHKDSKGRLQFTYQEQPALEMNPSTEMQPLGQTMMGEDEGQRIDQNPRQAYIPSTQSAEQKDIPPMSNAMSPEEDRKERMGERARRSQTPRPRQDYAPVQYGLVKDDSIERLLKAIKARKANYASKPNKIRKPPRGDEDVGPNGNQESQGPNPNMDAAHTGGLG
jgi:hypothetical protein